MPVSLRPTAAPVWPDHLAPPGSPRKSQSTACLVCGRKLGPRRRRYCSDDCGRLARRDYLVPWQAQPKQRRRTKRWRKANADRLRLAKKAHYEANRGRYRAAMRRRYYANKEGN